jgi:hypothetical protein
MFTQSGCPYGCPHSCTNCYRCAAAPTLSGFTPRRRGGAFFAIALTLALLGGCASQVVSSNPRSVVVDAGKPPNRNSAEAQRLADAECAKHKRVAQMTGRPLYGQTNEYVFACVD